ncbi:MAG: formate dehydrogenase accessory protein FdhE [Rubrivivax sp.]|nr:formate dehydrogenase accessory protein FdhE [Rubrivivax sp.]
MSVTATVRVLPAEEIAARAGGHTAPYRWPERSTFFAERAMRLRQLAHGHAMGDFLLFVARLAEAQQAALERLGRDGGVAVPDAAAVDRASLAGKPPLAAADGPRDPAWQGVLREIVRALRTHVTSGPAAEALARLERADEVFLDRQADALLNGVMAGLDLAAAPVVAAALQAQWTHQVIELVRAHEARGPAGAQAQTQPVGMLDDTGICPCCGSRPVVSIARSGGDASGQRYLHCSLCGTEWHLPRGRCAHCGASGSEKIAYLSLDRQDGARDEEEPEASARAARATIQAETCDACGHYLKLVHGEREPLAEPVADDLASITLDLLVAETGKQRHGINLMLLFGDPDGAAADEAVNPGATAPPGGS